MRNVVPARLARAGQVKPGLAVLDHLGDFAHAQRATGYFSARTCRAKRGVAAFLDEFALVHCGGRCHPVLIMQWTAGVGRLGG